MVSNKGLRVEVGGSEPCAREAAVCRPCHRRWVLGDITEQFKNMISGWESSNKGDGTIMLHGRDQENLNVRSSKEAPE